MKILKIELQNINSLKSETPIIIDFESDSFKDVGLFAITGSTGAGKTTILDAITIALYREVARFNRSNIKAGLLDVVSYGANEALSRVTFETKGVRYEAQWHIRLATKTGKKLSNPNETVYLKNLSDEKIVAETKKEVDFEMERITQLTYQQFLRSVLLAQGEFAAFLSADAKEKGNLLQQIAGEEIYLKIGEALLTKINSEQKALERIKAKINTEDLLSEDKCKELLEEEHLNALKIKNLQLEQKEFDRILLWYSENEKLIKKQKELAKEEVEIATEMAIQKEKLERLSLHEKAEPFKMGMDEMLRVEKEELKRVDRSANLNQLLLQLNENLRGAQKSETTSKEIHSKMEINRNNWLPKLLEVTTIDTEIRNSEIQLKTNESTRSNLSSAIDSLSEYNKTKRGALESNGKKVEEIETFLKNNHADQELEKLIGDLNAALTLRESQIERITLINRQLQQGEKELAETQDKLQIAERTFTSENDLLERLGAEHKELSDALALNQLTDLLQKQKNIEHKKSACRELAQLAGNYKEQIETKTTLINEKEGYEKIDKELLSSYNTLEEQLSSAKISLKDAEKILELEQTILRFDEERKKLEKGKACNLCGATEHPYVEKYAILEISASKQNVETRKKTVELVQKELKNIEIKQAENKTKLNGITSQITNIQQLIEKTAYHFNQFESEFSIENQQAFLKAIEPLNEASLLLTDQIETVQKLQKQKEEKELLLNKKRELIATIQTNIKVLDTTKLSINKNRIDFSTELEELIAINLNNEEKLSNQLSTFKLTLPSVEETRQFIKRVEQRSTQFQNKTKELVEINNNIKLLLSEIESIDNQLKEKTTELNKIAEENKKTADQLREISANRNEILPLEISTTTKQKELELLVEQTKAELEKTVQVLNQLITEQATTTKELETNEKELIELRISYNSLKTDFEELLSKSNYNTRQEIEAALLNPNVKLSFETIRKNLEERRGSYITLDTYLKEQFAKQNLEKLFEMSLEEALTKLTESKGVVDLTHKRAGEIKNQLAKDNEIKERNKETVAELNLQEQKLKTWLQLKELLGKSKESFNTYVQRLTLKNLINLANLHLFKLNKRYSLKLNENYKEGEELNFMLVDHYQTDEARFVDTSSGGEKFIISLALALGLSDLSSHNVNIGSLFIDEGFGTLDNNTLETVIATLETLQSQGKMIGIISHVENLKERIPVQIQVIKRNNGVSVISV